MPKRSLYKRKAPPAEKRKQQVFDLKHDEDIDSGDDESITDASSVEEENDQEEELTVEQLRKKRALEYLQSIKGNKEDASEASGDEQSGGSDSGDEIAERLRRDRLSSQGKYFRAVAHTLQNHAFSKVVLSGHQLAVTAVALSSDDRTVYSVSKDNSLIAWDIETSSKQILIPKWKRSTHQDVQCHSGELLSVAVTSDKRYVACGGRDATVKIIDTRNNELIKSFTGHRDAITSMAFRKDSYSLFSGSLDRTIKHWDLNEMGYLETLFGHQDGINSIDCWNANRPVSASSDRTVRLWKVNEDTHLVYRGHKANIDNVNLLTIDHYVSSAQDGTLSLWKETQKKPVVSVHVAHGLEGISPRWISSLAALKMSDTIATGSNDGYVKLWEVDAEQRHMENVANIEVEGFVNGLALSEKFLVAGTGNEHRLGRWWHMKGNKNKVVIIPLPELEEAHYDDDEEEDSENSEDFSDEGSEQSE